MQCASENASTIMPSLVETNALGATEATIYVHAHSRRPRPGAGWGAVIEMQGKSIELNDQCDEDTDQRMLLRGTIAALEAVPMDQSVLIICAVESLTKWTIPRLSEMHKDGYRAARKRELANLDLYEPLHALTCQRPSVKTLRVGQEGWDEHHQRAAMLAMSPGSVGHLVQRVLDTKRHVRSNAQSLRTEAKQERVVLRSLRNDQSADGSLPWE